MIDFGIKDIVDILIVALLLYYVYRLMKKSGTLSLFYGVLAFILVWVLAYEIFDMRLTGSIVDKFMSIGLIVLVILFQDQIKRFLIDIGGPGNWRHIRKIFRHDKSNEKEHAEVMTVVYACMSMSKSKTGALIVFQRKVPLTDFEKTGDEIDRHQRPPDREYFLQEFAAPRRSDDNSRPQDCFCRVYSAGKPRHEHSQKSRSAPPGGARHEPADRCGVRDCQRRDRRDIGSRTRLSSMDLEHILNQSLSRLPG